MDLDLSGVQLTPIITCTIENILEPEDLAALASGTLSVSPEEEAKDIVRAAKSSLDNPADLKVLRERHHSVARLIASGQTNKMAAIIAGYTESYISILLNNPAMQELIGLYQIQYGSSAMVIGEKLRELSMLAVEEIGERLHNEPEKIAIHELTSVAKLGLDRSGHGPTSTQHVVSEEHVIDHARLQELNANARAASSDYIVSRAKVIASLPAPRLEADDASN